MAQPMSEQEQAIFNGKHGCPEKGSVDKKDNGTKGKELKNDDTLPSTQKPKRRQK